MRHTHIKHTQRYCTVLGEVVGATLGHFSAKSLQDDQQSYNKKAYQHRYQWTMADMRKAGLNPILAAGAGLGGGAAASSGIATSQAVTGAKLAAEIELMGAQSDKAKAEKLNIEAQTGNTEQNIDIYEPLGQAGRAVSGTVDVVGKGIAHAYGIADQAATKIVEALGTSAKGSMGLHDKIKKAWLEQYKKDIAYIKKMQGKAKKTFTRPLGR